MGFYADAVREVQIGWEPGTPRDKIWDMGHIPGQQYRDLRNMYLNHTIKIDEFLKRYRTSANYRVEHYSVNRARGNEG